MKSHRVKHRIHAAVVLTCTAVLVWASAVAYAHRTAEVPPALHAGLWLALLGLAVASPIPLPRRRTEVSLTPVVDFAATVALNPAVAIGLRCIWGLLAVVGRGWTAASILSVGSAVLPVGCATLTYRAVGRWPGLEADATGQFFFQTGLAALVYLALRHGLAAWQDALQQPRFSHGVRRDRVDRVVWDAILLPCGLLLAIVHLRTGIVGTSLFFIPLILARHVGRLWEHAKSAQIETARILMDAIDAADPFTNGHSQRVSRMSLAVGKRLGMLPADLAMLEYAALLHDIGRTAIQREIVFKRGEVTESERDILRSHPRVGRDIIERIGFLPQTAELVYSHHEQPDGKGYPEELAGDSIPMGSRILMVVAAFDAMTSDRPYRRGMSTADAFEELLARGGTQFFSDVVQALIESFADGTLFEHFTPDVLEEHASGAGSSRAIAEFAARRRVQMGPSSKPGPAQASGAGTDLPLSDAAADPRDVPERVLQLTRPGWSLRVAGGSDVGCVRDTNEDSWGIFPGEEDQACLLVVADGMGGQAAGEVASQLAVESVRGVFFGEKFGCDAGAALREAVQAANDLIHARASGDSDLGGMGTTCVTASIIGTTLTVAHVGDSRAYWIDANCIQQLTRDHNLAEEFALMGRRGPEGSQHILTRTVGGSSHIEVDVTPAIQLQANNRVVLCSDGLFNVVSQDEILEAVLEAAPAVACRRLVDKALRRGGPDNITVVVAQVERGEEIGDTTSWG